VKTSVKGGIDALATTAGAVTDVINEKAVRASTAQMCAILEIALDEIKNRPIANRPASLTATVNIGITALEMQIHLDPNEAARKIELIKEGSSETA
jgi:hypothetical protein